MGVRAGSENAVNGQRWRWYRNTQKRQLRASAVVRARLGAAQSGLGRAGSTGWCRRGLLLKLGSGQRRQGRLGCGSGNGAGGGSGYGSGKDWGGGEIV